MEKIKLFFLLIIIFLVCPFVFINSAGDNTVKIAVSLEPDTFDVQAYSTFHYGLIAKLFMGTLLDRDTSGNIISYVCKFYKQVQPDLWEFELNYPIYFTNGKILNSTDVKESLLRIASINQKDFSTIADITVLSSKKFAIKTRIPDPLLASRLVPMGYIVPFEDVTAKGGFEKYFSDYKNIDGFGPYKIKEWKKGEYITLEPNSKYWDKTSKRSPLLIKFIEDLDQRVQDLLTGKIDLISDIPPVYTLDIAKNKNTKIVKGDFSQYIFGNYNIPDPDSPLFDRNIRLALNFGIDKNKLLELINFGNGNIIPTIFVRQAFGYWEHEPYPYDPAKAIKLIQASKYKGNIKLTCLVSSVLESLSYAVKSQLEKIGIELELHFIDRDQGILQWLVQQKKEEDIFLLNPVDPMLDASYHIETLINRFPRQNLPLIEELNKLFIKSNKETDPEKRKEILKQIQEKIYSESLYLFFWQNNSIYGLSDKVNNFVPYPDGMLRF